MPLPRERPVTDRLAAALLLLLQLAVFALPHSESGPRQQLHFDAAPHAGEAHGPCIACVVSHAPPTPARAADQQPPFTAQRGTQPVVESPRLAALERTIQSRAPPAC